MRHRRLLIIVQLLGLNLLPQQVALEEIRNLPQAVCRVLARRDAEDLVELFEGFAFGFLVRARDGQPALSSPTAIHKYTSIARLTGIKSNTNTHPTIFHAAYHPNAPCGLNALRILGHVIASTALKNHVVAVARLMPSVRIYSGYASALYVKGTGPSPGLYTMPNK